MWYTLVIKCMPLIKLIITFILLEISTEFFKGSLGSNYTHTVSIRNQMSNWSSCQHANLITNHMHVANFSYSTIITPVTVAIAT